MYQNDVMKVEFHTAVQDERLAALQPDLDILYARRPLICFCILHFHEILLKVETKSHRTLKEVKKLPIKKTFVPRGQDNDFQQWLTVYLG